MKRITIILIVLLVIAGTAGNITWAALTISDGTAVAKNSPITYYLEMYRGDDGYALCDDGQFIITVNGADSIYFQCVQE